MPSNVVSHPPHGFRIRPHFEQTVAQAPDEIRARIWASDASNADEFEINLVSAVKI